MTAIIGREGKKRAQAGRQVTFTRRGARVANESIRALQAHSVFLCFQSAALHMRRGVFLVGNGAWDLEWWWRASRPCGTRVRVATGQIASGIFTP